MPQRIFPGLMVIREGTGGVEEETTIQSGDQVTIDVEHGLLSALRGMRPLYFSPVHSPMDDKFPIYQTCGVRMHQEQARLFIDVLTAFTGLDFVEITEDELRKNNRNPERFMIWRVS